MALSRLVPLGLCLVAAFACAPLAAASAAAIPADSIRALIAAQRFAEADTAAHALLKQAEREHGPRSLETARALDLIVDAMRAWPASLPFAERAARIREALPTRHDAEDAASWMSLGRVRIRLGKYHDARAPLQKALEASERALGPDDLYIARILNNLALATEQDGDDAAAKRLYQRAIAIRELRLPPNDLLTADTYDNLGRVCDDMGDFEDGEASFQKALSIRAVAAPEDQTSIAGILVELGTLQYHMGQYVSSRTSLERAIPILRSASDDSVSLANGLQCLGLVLRDTGDFERSRADFTEALRIRERLLGSDHQEVAVSLDALGVLDDELGDYAAARPLLERALSIRLRSFGTRHVNTAISLLNLATLLGELKDVPRAESLCDRGIAILRENYGEKHQLVADGLTRAATLRMRDGDAAGARALYQRALSIQEEVLGLDHPDAASTGIGLAQAEWHLHEPRSALAAALRFEATAREQLRLTERALSEREALRYAATRTSGLGVAFSIARTGLADSLNREVWDALIRARGSVLDEMAWRHRAIAAASDTLAARLLGRVTAAGSRVSSLLVRGPIGNDSVEYKRRVTEARDGLEAAERALAEQSASYRALRATEGTGLSDVASSLPAGAALVGVARYERTEPRSGSRGGEYIAFVLGSDARVSVVPLGAASGIESLVSQFLVEAGPDALARGESPAEAELACRAVGERLRRRVWDPLVPAIGSARLVLLVPDAALCLVPFAALPVGASSYLIETGPTLHYLSAERDVAAAAAPSHRKEGLLAVGGPDFDDRSPFASLGGKELRRHAPEGRIAAAAEGSESTYRGAHSSCLEFRSVRFQALPATGREVRDIASLWRKRSLPVSALLVGGAASEGEFKARAAQAGVLHIATHGFFLNGGCASAATEGRGIGGIQVEEAPRKDSRDRAQENATGRLSANPLLLSGLAFAGANHRDAARGLEEDGILTAEEIATLDLSGVRWAVLSACDTGKGEVEAGEGVLGLRRAFQIAGAGTLIMSLWAVGDQATRLWMKDLYEERLSRGRSIADAVRDAGLSVLRGRRAAGRSTHPSYWSGFVAAGDWK